MADLIGTVKLWRSYFGLHYRASLAYRKSFWLQIAAMFINNVALVMIWYIFFATFPGALSSRGVSLRHVLLLFALMSSAYGCMTLFCGGAFTLSASIIQNKLDGILILPRHPYLLTLLSKSYVSGWGDLTFGLALFAFSQPLTISSCLLFLFFTSTAAGMFAGTVMIMQSLSFFMGNSEQVHRLGVMGMLTFGTYPEEIFSGAVRLLIYTVLPVGVFVYLPVRTMLNPSVWLFLSSAIASVFVVVLSVKIFNSGLLRYESGNQMASLK